MNSKLLLALAVALAIAAAALGAVRSARAATTSNLRLLYSAEDAFRNYDFDNTSAVSPSNVDWAVNFLFKNNAEINKIKVRLGNQGFTGTGSTEWGRLADYADGAGNRVYVWDGDGGRKKGGCFYSHYYHYRIYADGDDRMYTPAWGFYVFGTSHIDNNECSPSGTWFGRSEDAENYIANAAAAEWGLGRVASDTALFYNIEPYREEGNHIWQNSGNATYVNVP